MAVVSWSIWSHRNGVVHGNPRQNPLTGVSNSLLFFNEFQSAKTELVTPYSGSRFQLVRRWKKPPLGGVKSQL